MYYSLLLLLSLPSFSLLQTAQEEPLLKMNALIEAADAILKEELQEAELIIPFHITQHSTKEELKI